mmetsp:Transcript_19718/g.33145  ORF Transcript_19718/g.33145 Transcript_19718/m.33145 type:complete len:362 (-) Transcript_19718:54-1139(-)
MKVNSLERPVRLHHVQTGEDGVRLAVHEWPGNGSSSTEPNSLPTVVFLHGTGFHARCWDRIIVELPRSVRCLSIDQCGHGQSDKPNPGGLPCDWNVLGDRVLSLLRTLNVRGALGVGHSSGGHSISYVAVADGDIFSALLLLDPVISPPSSYGRPPPSLDQFVGISGRRNEFESPESMLQRLQGRMPYKLWRLDVLVDYCVHGLINVTTSPSSASSWRWGPTGTVTGGNAQYRGSSSLSMPHHGEHGGKWVLACPPQCEAAMYQGAYLDAIAPQLHQVRLPVRIIRADGEFSGFDASKPPNFLHSPTDPQLWKDFGTPAEDYLLAGETHFFPQSNPLLVSAHVSEMLHRLCPKMDVRRSKL